ncbi:hypothetical protein TD95_001794 [Thielaviopsis punctulata]|uniref:Sulfotransferase domain-containing protein n=1 Tax=Thielaviopsis punctulata TaxID=72032 RepID=A0A0F4ZLH6_9PEZI|nr:hypothetical protein TD95_001794 [Thielaviopsis punctulata]
MPKYTNGGVAEKDANPRIVPMRVIVCGLMRTGTLSMRAALRELGIHDVYHMQTLGQTAEDDVPLWTRAIDAKYNNKGTFTREDWDELLGSYQAITDVPGSFFGVELAAAYPEAKIIILNRDPEKWYESCLSSIHAAFSSISALDKLLILTLDPPLRTFAMFMHKVNTVCQAFSWPERDKALAFYNRHYAEYRSDIATVSPDGSPRVLEYTVKDGWAPLCAHLNLPVPLDVVDGKMVERPFPRLNDSSSYAKAAVVKMRAMRKRVLWRVLGFLQKAALVGFVGYYFRDAIMPHSKMLINIGK